MPRIHFTDRTLRAIKPEPGSTRTNYWDASVPGPGVFGMRVAASGGKSWCVLYRVGGVGKVKRLTLGEFPTKSYATARAEGLRALRRAQDGDDPAKVKKVERQHSRETFASLFESYEKHASGLHDAGQFRSWPEIRRSLRAGALPAFKDRPVREIRRRDVVDLVNEKARTAPVAANRLAAHLSMLFNFGVEADMLPANPAAGLRKRKEQPRERVLSADEIRDLWAYLADDGTALALSRGSGKGARTMPAETAATLRDVFKMLLLCGQRLGETSKMKWADVDLSAKLWTIPASDSKNGVAHRVPLNRQAVDILETRSKAPGRGEVFVFPAGPGSEASAHIWSKRTASAIASATGIGFTAHDLRRTVATMLGELGVSGDVIGLVLNHKKPGITGRVYNHAQRDGDKRAALDRWAAELERIVASEAAKILSFGQGA
jgi:integrase